MIYRIAAIGIVLLSLGCSHTQPAAAPALLPWSDPVAGLRCRVEYFDDESDVAVMVRLENVSAAPLAAPADDQGGPGNPDDYQVFVQPPGGSWALQDGFMEDMKSGIYPTVHPPHPLVLQPGESALVFLRLPDTMELGYPARIKIAIHWHGSTLETPPILAAPTPDWPNPPRGLPFPDHFPTFAESGVKPGEENGDPSIRLIEDSNHDLALVLAEYDPAAVRAELDRRLSAETHYDGKLYLAALAAPRGSSAGRQLLRDALKSTDYNRAINLHQAISIAMRCYATDPPALPDWLVQLAIAALADNRKETGLEQLPALQERNETVGDLADEYPGELPYFLARYRCKQAVPVLIERVRRATSTDAIAALGELGDPAGEEAVLEVLRGSAPLAKVESEMLSPDPPLRNTVIALGQLKSRAALPILLKMLYQSDVVQAVEAIGDRSAIPALEMIVAAGKPEPGHGNDAASDHATVSAARVALATLDPGDPIPRYCKLLADYSSAIDARASLVDRLSHSSDPRAIPALLAAIRTDPSWRVITPAIDALSTFKYRSTVLGLIGCLNTDFTNRYNTAVSEADPDYPFQIAAALRKLTGQPLPADPQQWANWMRDYGEHDAELK